MAFLKNMIIGSDAPGPAQAATINPFDTSQGAQTFYESQQALNQQNQFLQALQAQNGLGNQSQVFGQQQALAGQLQGVANGTGPNPALAQFNQATGQNIAAQGALMAGQRGTQANAGLLARQIAQQGGNIQQQAAGQAATMQAQQQLAGMGALQQQQAAMAANANQMATQQQNQVNQNSNSALQGQQAALGAYGAQNNASVSSQNSINAANSAKYAADNAIGAALAGGLAQGAGAAMVAASSGGMIPSPAAMPGVAGPRSHVTQYFMSQPAMARGGQINPMNAGHGLVPGDSPKNDIVPAVLSPKEIVIPRSITMGKNAPEKAAEFVAQVLARQKKRA